MIIKKTTEINEVGFERLYLIVVLKGRKGDSRYRPHPWGGGLVGSVPPTAAFTAVHHRMSRQATAFFRPMG